MPNLCCGEIVLLPQQNIFPAKSSRSFIILGYLETFFACSFSHFLFLALMTWLNRAETVAISLHVNILLHIEIVFFLAFLEKCS